MSGDTYSENVQLDLSPVSPQLRQTESVVLPALLKFTETPDTNCEMFRDGIRFARIGCASLRRQIGRWREPPAISI